jgi:hypothetical protein
MFSDSLPGAKDSPEERANKLELELKKARDKIAEYQALDSQGQNRFTDPRKTLADGARSLTDKIRAGQHISPEDIFRASKPLMRDLSPLFDRMRVREQRRRIDALAGEFTRKYDLNPEQQKALAAWFEKRSNEEAKRWADMLGRDDVRLEDMMKASRDVRPDDGVDKFMEGVLSGEKLASFKADRLNEKAYRLQQETDMKVQRMDSIVKLSDAQRDQMFGVIARNSRDYDPAMVLEGAGGQINAQPSANGREAMLSILTPDQRATYDAERRRRYEEAEKDMNAVGMTMPPNWEMLDEDGWK